MSIATNATKAFAPASGRDSGRAPRDIPAPRPAGLALVLGRGSTAIPARTRRDMFRAVLFVVSGLLVLAALGLTARAGGTHVLVIPTDDGYGLSDCLTGNAPCGPIVASAYCKAQGHGSSGSFGPVEAGATASDAAGPAAQGSRGFRITCRD